MVTAKAIKITSRLHETRVSLRRYVKINLSVPQCVCWCCRWHFSVILSIIPDVSPTVVCCGRIWQLLVVAAECWRQAKQQRRHDISILGQWPHYTQKQSISHADLRDLPHCALGKTINVKQLCSSPGPHKWDSLLGYRDNSSPSPERKWKALYPWDMINSQQAWSREERCLYSACLEGRPPLNSITFQPAFCLLKQQDGSSRQPVTIWSAHGLLCILFKTTWLPITRMQILLKYYLCSSPLQWESQGPANHLAKYESIRTEQRCCQSWSH